MVSGIRTTLDLRRLEWSSNWIDEGKKEEQRSGSNYYVVEWNEME